MDSIPAAKDDAEFIQIDNITKKFGQVTAVQGVSMNIKKGEVFCLLGGSGSGKSTLLRMLAGFDDPTEGRIIIDGEDISGKPPERLPTNMMFQSYALFPHMTVERNVGYGLRRDRVPKSQIKQRVDDILEMVKLTEFAKRKPAQLSGGQRQRVALARCIIKRPKVLLLDEPLGALDKKLREETQQELLKIQHDLGLTFIIVTHDQEEAMNMATRIGVMDQGRIIQVATPRELYEQPNSIFIADFVGSLNKNKGQIIGREGVNTLVRLSEDAVLKIESPLEHEAGDQVVVTTRPEKLEIFSIDHEVNALTQNAILGRVTYETYSGDQTHYTVELKGGGEVQISERNQHVSTKAAINEGDEVRIDWPARNSRIFKA